MASLAEIRAKLKEQESRTSGNNSGGGDNSIYPFWNIKEGESATLRFLPDGDESNTFFWKERLMIKLPFAGVKGETDSRPVQVQIPCMEMYGETCDILNEVRGWFKDPSLEDMGRKYWKKRSYIFQGFVTDNPLSDDQAPENPIRRFIIGPQIFQIIKAALMDPDMEELPTDYTAGVDFRLNKTSKGGYADYGTSNWARRERPLSDAEMNAVNTHGLFNLNDFLPKKPGEIEVKTDAGFVILNQAFQATQTYHGNRPPGNPYVIGLPADRINQLLILRKRNPYVDEEYEEMLRKRRLADFLGIDFLEYDGLDADALTDTIQDIWVTDLDESDYMLQDMLYDLLDALNLSLMRLFEDELTRQNRTLLSTKKTDGTGFDATTGIRLEDEDPWWHWVREDFGYGNKIDLYLNQGYGYSLNIKQGDFELYDYKLGSSSGNSIDIQQ